MRRRRSEGGFGTAVVICLVLAALGGLGYFLWQKKVRGELSISLQNIMPSEREVPWPGFSAMLNTSRRAERVVVGCIPVKIDDSTVTCVPPSAAGDRGAEISVHNLSYDGGLHATLAAACEKFNAPVLYLTIQMPDARVVAVRSQP
ncbi:MAG: hypothetical protein ABIF71_09530 [Planctomycetota bacterium]